MNTTIHPSRLKSLELHGYKTFASRTVFEFAGAITAIVGPNGSGKSNIADALRWVLGEQSYTLLRGKRTEDMIFAGSEQRSRAGMASATAVFDNSDGWLPIDFSEVAIARRAYRDGNNEYLLNGQRVRLRDVSELLAQSGLAERTYTIIGQGLVDAALALKAEERRRLFEEAAGIGLHRSRREEALRRLDTTLRNLDRVQDILVELQPRLHSLERQAQRAQEHARLEADLRLTLREWYGYHWHRAQADLTEAREVVAAQEAAVEVARRVQLEVEQKLDVNRNRIHDLRAQLNSGHRQSAQLHAQRETVSRNLAITAERLRGLETQLQNLNAELNRSELEIQQRLDRLEDALREVQHLEAELSEANAQAEVAGQRLLERQVEREALEKAAQSARQSLADLTAKQAHSHARLGEQQAQIEHLRASLESAGQSRQQASAEEQSAQGDLQASVRHLRQAEAERKAADHALAAHRQQLAALEADRRETLEALAAERTEVSRLRARLEVLDQAEQTLTGYASGARLLLQAAREARLSGARSALNALMVVPAELEVAIAAALGEYLDAVILDTEADPDQALDVLGGEAARGTLLPLGCLRAQPKVETIEKGEGVLGLAADLVDTPPDLCPVVDLLLGNVWVVRERAVARRVLANWRGNLRDNAEAWPDLRVVTLRGEVYHANGAIQAGSAGQTILSRPRQRRELSEQLAGAERRVAELTQQLAGQGRTLAEQKVEAKRLEEQAGRARQGEERGRTAHSQYEARLEKARRQLEWQQERCKQLQIEIGATEANIADGSRELTQLDAKIAQARHALDEQLTLLSALPLDEYRTQLAHWNTRVAVANQALTDARARRKERQDALERIEKTIQSARERLAKLADDHSQLQAEKGNLRQAEAALTQQIESLRAQIEPAEAELEVAEAEQLELQSQEAEARQASSVAEHHHAQARIQLARRQEKLETLRRRIEDDFGLVAFEYAEQISGPTPLPLEGMVEQLPRVEVLLPEVEEMLKRQQAQLRRIGAINPEAQTEFREVRQRYDFLTEQVNDLRKAEADIRQIITELDALMQREFLRTFESVADEFRQIFSRLFGGGSARLVLTGADDLSNAGIDIEARLPGRREQGLSLLSGGERSLTAAALVFALLRISPPPFCVLDEVDAMLDEANVGRFREMLSELSQSTQFIIITHNRNTVQVADVVYGVTMGRDSSSQVISLKMDEFEGGAENLE